MKSVPIGPWVPGVLRFAPCGDGVAELLVGADATWWDGAADISAWNGHLVFAATDDLTPLHRQTIGLDAHLRALAPHPRLTAVARASTLAVVPGEHVETLRETGVRLYELGTHPTRKRFAFVAERHRTVLAEIEGPFDFDRETPDVLDRLLRAASDEMVSLEAIERARFIAECAEQPLEAIEAGLAEIEAHAEHHATAAAAMATTLREAADDRVHLPGFGAATREVWPETKVEGSEQPNGLQLFVRTPSGEASTLALPARTIWQIDGVKPWVPPSWVAAEALLESERRAQRSRRRIALVLRFTAFALLVAWVTWTLTG